MIFSSSDAMILYSIHREKPGVEASLKDIIAFVDYINHDILTYEELNGSIHKLNETGLIHISGNTIGLTADYIKWRNEKFKSKKKPSVYKEMKEIEIYLNERIISSSIPSDNKDLIRKEFQQALTDYLNKI